MDQVIGMLKQYQANSVVFSSTAHGFHWNVEGPLFTQYHELFGNIYEDVDGTVDTIAEWIRVFDVQSPYTLQQLIDLQNFGDVLTSSNSPIVMSRMLLSMNDKMINDIKMMFDIATESKEQGLANFLADRQTAHEKWGWFLRASIKQTIN
jgi:starvation-inducible DNA-binding protein